MPRGKRGKPCDHGRWQWACKPFAGKICGCTTGWCPNCGAIMRDYYGRWQRPAPAKRRKRAKA